MSLLQLLRLIIHLCHTKSICYNQFVWITASTSKNLSNSISNSGVCLSDSTESHQYQYIYIYHLCLLHRAVSHHEETKISSPSCVPSEVISFCPSSRTMQKANREAMSRYQDLIMRVVVLVLASIEHAHLLNEISAEDGSLHRIAIVFYFLKLWKNTPLLLLPFSNLVSVIRLCRVRRDSPRFRFLCKLTGVSAWPT